VVVGGGSGLGVVVVAVREPAADAYAAANPSTIRQAQSNANFAQREA
jgi:hypothetical protein